MRSCPVPSAWPVVKSGFHPRISHAASQEGKSSKAAAWESTQRGVSMVECRLSATAPLDRCVFYWFISRNITSAITLLFLYLFVPMLFYK